MANVKRNINYLNRDFTSFRTDLINYARTYFPDTYNDFTAASPGMMFMEMASYVGDVLSFYLDSQFQETFIQYAQQSTSLYDLAYMLGYKPKDTYVSTVDIDLYQYVPATGSGVNTLPDWNYALQVAANTSVSTNPGNVNFIIENTCNFTFSSSQDPTEVTVLQAAAGVPTSFLLRKTRKAISGEIKTTTFTFGNYQAYPTVNIVDTNIVGVLDVVDSSGNKWYEVDYLAQEMIMDSLKNTNPNDPNYFNDTQVPYLLKLKKIQNRFATRLTEPGVLQLQFGAGNAEDTDEYIVPNPDNVGIGLPYGKNSLNVAYSPNNFLFTNTYGVAPTNTVLTVRYIVGGGVTSNVQSNSITQLLNPNNVTFVNSNIASTITAQQIFNGFYVNNPNAASGGNSGDTPFTIRQNSLGAIQQQQRTITQDDYLIRSLSMPSQYGVVSKAFIEPTKIINLLPGEIPSSLDLYVLSYNSNNQLVTASDALKQNLTNYLSYYRSVNDSIRIRDAFIINIGVNFEIITLPNFDNNQVLFNCITALQNYFLIDRWQINQPIVLRELYILLDKIQGVQTVKNISISNLTGESLGYSNYAYDIQSAIVSNVIYPSIDPMIFEVKYPNTDIQGRIVSL
jgi:hypothetical protein